MSAPDNTLSLVVNNQALSGWQAIRITRGAEMCPSAFDLAVTEKFPSDASTIDVKPFDPCQVMIGADTVITGYVDRYIPSIGPGQHGVRIVGRSRCEDVVDSHVKVKGMQISGANALSLAQQLAQPFGVTVSSLSGPGPAIPQFNITLGETCYEIIERIARYAQLLVYDDVNGNLVLSQVGSVQMASGFTEGVNVQAATAAFSSDERFSEYDAAVMSTDKLADIGDGGNLIQQIFDPTVPRFRLRIIVSEQIDSRGSLAVQRANWEKARRIGRSQMVTLTCDSWRDSAGTLWQPNALAPISMPSLKLNDVTWVIGQVSFLLDAEEGTRTELMLMPPEAFQPEPNPLQLYDWQIARELEQAQAASEAAAARDQAGP